jgi:predicted lactoylglutathione lyase
MQDFKTFLEAQRPKDEAKTKEVIISLADNDFETLEDQMKGVELLKGIAAADNPTANEFMKRLSGAYTEIAKDIGAFEKTGEEEEEAEEEEAEEEEAEDEAEDEE